MVRNELGLSNKTICEWSVKRQGKISGKDMIVEIDESKFGKCKYNVGRIVVGQWVFGGICRETKSTFLVPVEKRDKDTLLQIIKDKIEPGSIIIYNCLQDEGYQHLTVNHSVNFVDPTTLAHTNTVERLWREVKLKVPLFGRRKKHFLGYLACSMFVMAFEEDKRFHQFLLEVAVLYNPLHPPHPQP
ncbi:hypothetical protein Pcinc_012737 [Petrolisthes cinctipes]|uniref:ISXO2-like transposase domain-containing protein n=1 Tax=Petrolisthes cinctipes TaxID=88211 RepID=A0AAE1G0D3_PETCI|nr:hypothetical protein Pcinc_012737 [Petrolisthes cinctipes]